MMNVNVWNQNQAGTTIAANTDGTNFVLKVMLTMLYIKRHVVNEMLVMVYNVLKEP